MSSSLNARIHQFASFSSSLLRPLDANSISSCLSVETSLNITTVDAHNFSLGTAASTAPHSRYIHRNQALLLATPHTHTRVVSGKTSLWDRKCYFLLLILRIAAVLGAA